MVRSAALWGVVLASALAAGSPRAAGFVQARCGGPEANAREIGIDLARPAGAGHLLVVMLDHDLSGPARLVRVSDEAGDDFIPLDPNPGDGSRAELWAAVPLDGGASTVRADFDRPTQVAIFVAEYAGADVPPLPVAAFTKGIGSEVFSPAFTPPSGPADYLLVAAAWGGVGQGISSPSSPFTARASCWSDVLADAQLPAGGPSAQAAFQGDAADAGWKAALAAFPLSPVPPPLADLGCGCAAGGHAGAGAGGWLLAWSLAAARARRVRSPSSPATGSRRSSSSRRTGTR